MKVVTLGSSSENLKVFVTCVIISYYGEVTCQGIRNDMVSLQEEAVES
jgi:hypothetical protein